MHGYRYLGNYLVLCDPALHADLRAHTIALAVRRGLHRPVNQPRVHDRPNTSVRSAVGSYWTQADHNRRANSLSHPRIPAIPLGSRQPLLRQFGDRTNRALLRAWGFFWPDVDSSCGAVCRPRTLDW